MKSVQTQTDNHQWVAIERIVAQVDEKLNEEQFVALCAALGVTDSEVLEWGLITLSTYDMLTY